MKIRSDFVTNSSSSSFIVFGKEVNLEDIDLTCNKYIAGGKELGDGYDVFELTEEIYEYLKNEIITAKLTNKFEDSDLEYLSFYKYYIMFDACSDILMKNLIDNIKPEEMISVLEFSKDYHSSRDIEDIKYNYGLED